MPGHSGAGRVVLFGSSQHSSVRRIDPADFELGSAPGRGRYAATKLLTMLALRVHELDGRAPLTVSVDPGFVRTGLGRSATGLLRLLLTLTRPIQIEPTRAASLVAAVLDEPNLVNGAYVAARGPARRSALATDSRVARMMQAWTTEQLAPWATAQGG